MEDRFDEVMEFRSSLSPETDRGCALMAAAFLDSELELLIRSCVVDDRGVSDEVLGQAKPLGTFSSRIDVAYLLGLISLGARRDLHLIRKIRNEFGHVHHPLSFTDQAIASRCRELSFSLRDERDPPRKRFISSAVGVLAIIHTAMSNRDRITAREEPNFEAAKIRQKALLAAVNSALQEAPSDSGGEA